MTELERINILDKILEELYPNTKCFLSYEKDYELLIAVILSAQALDKSVNKVTPVLFNKYKTLEELSNADLNDVIEIIKPVGLAKNKATNIIKTARILSEEYNNTIPKNFDELQKLPGVGYKTAGVVMAELYDFHIIPVDTHIFRVSNRIIFNNKYNNADKISKELTNYYSGKSYIDFHRRIILFGRNICSSRSPKCSSCPFTNICYHK